MARPWSAFDVIGPVMVGPSSSHTAGAAKIGYFARIINGQKLKKVKLLLHGSFGKVCKGHRTDRAIVGGLLGYLPDSGKIKNSIKLAQQKDIELIIKQANLGDNVHPNSVRIEMKNADGSFHRVRAKSIGGGKIEIREIDKIDCHIDMSYSCLIVLFDNRKTNALDLLIKVKDMNINVINFDTRHYKDTSLLEVEIRENFSRKIIYKLEAAEGVLYARFLNHLSNYQHFAK